MLDALCLTLAVVDEDVFGSLSPLKVIHVGQRMECRLIDLISQLFRAGFPQDNLSFLSVFDASLVQLLAVVGARGDRGPSHASRGMNLRGAPEFSTLFRASRHVSLLLLFLAFLV